MLSPFLTNSSSFDEMASLSRPLIGTDRSTPKSADKYVLSMSVVQEKTEHEQLQSMTISRYQFSLRSAAFSD